jgi:hypothetical protein
MIHHVIIFTHFVYTVNIGFERLSTFSDAQTPFFPIHPLYIPLARRFIALFMLSIQVNFGLPFFFLYGGFRCIACFGSLLSAIRCTCPYKVSCRLCSSRIIFPSTLISLLILSFLTLS